jgi:hypothetical protein
MTKEKVIEALVQSYCTKENENKTMDVTLVNVMAENIIKINNAEISELNNKNYTLKELIERLKTQLAAVSTITLGYIDGEYKVTEEMYGYSCAYKDVLNLYYKYEKTKDELNKVLVSIKRKQDFIKQQEDYIKDEKTE